MTLPWYSHCYTIISPDGKYRAEIYSETSWENLKDNGWAPWGVAWRYGKLELYDNSNNSFLAEGRIPDLNYDSTMWEVDKNGDVYLVAWNSFGIPGFGFLYDTIKREVVRFD